MPDRTTPVAEALAELAELLAPGRPAVTEEVLLAYEDPETYVRTHAGRLDERGIDEPVDDLAWIALVDALTAQGLLAEVDWKESGEEIRRQVRALESRPATDPWSLASNANKADEADEAEALDTYAFLTHYGALHLDVGTALAVLDIESDCYPLVLLPAARAAELTPLARRAGFAAAVLRPDTT
ncbi:hypothetical protein KQY30_33260 [Streptomyces sp. GMY02]|uniref:DUF6630 family protein n=1 Tax=Streptomyces sp. GMY02 TaxID=1333528 RepID=UPI001C2BD2A9|nr:DUF6630 family protein [Streptomyces sp. GMY02]QXE38384.1 hypothetical protein KQY30_33260 [Streptomyces sp. GMY02]